MEERQMSTTTMFRKFAGIIVLLAAARTSYTPAVKNPITARLGGDGMTPSAMSVDSGSQVAFVNGDTRPHQIYSNDCAELSSSILEPGQSAVARLRNGPKVCHYQDLLAPDSQQYWGTVQVAQPSTLIDFSTSS